MQVAVPQWYITGETPKPIKEEMMAIVDYLLEIVESMLIHLVMTTIKEELSYIIEEIEGLSINPDMPIKYKLTLSFNKISLL